MDGDAARDHRPLQRRLERAGRRVDQPCPPPRRGVREPYRPANGWRAARRWSTSQTIFGNWPDLRFRAARLYVGGDFVVSEWTATATHPDGRKLEWDGIDVFPFRDGLIARKDVYSTSGSARVLAS